MSTKKLILLALFVSQALVLSIIESFIPLPVAIPGVKLGLANIITLVVIVFFGFSEAAIVVIVRTVLASLYTGGWIIFLFSITGGIISTVVMGLLYRRMSGIFSIIGISIAGAVVHNIGQLIVASIFMKEFYIFTYLPILLISGVIMGCFIGLCTKFLVNALKRKNLF